MELVFGLIVLAVLLGLGVVVGGLAERNHLKSLAERERAVADMLVTTTRDLPDAVPGPQPPTLICGQAVVSSDYFKTFVASFKKLFGGELRTYRSIASRARREAVLRVLEESRRLGYNAVANLRCEGSDVSKVTEARQRNPVIMAGVMAYGTAYHARRGGRAGGGET